MLFFLVICPNNRITSHQGGHVGDRASSGGSGVGGERVSEWGHEIPAWLVRPRVRRINEWAGLARHSGIGAHTTIDLPLMRSAVREGFNLLLLSHRAWHSAERSLFRESIRGKIKLVPSAPSPLASRHKTDDYQLEPAQLQWSTGASHPAKYQLSEFGNFWQVAGFLFCTFLCNVLVLCAHDLLTFNAVQDILKYHE